MKKAIFALTSFFLCVVAQAEEKPTFELGVALGSQYLADYRGSKEYSVKAVPIPFFLYRGDRFKIDRKGMRGDVLRSENWELNVSAEVSLSGGQEDNPKRKGMPELDSTFEIGPSLNFALDGDVSDEGWLLRLPVRAVFAASTSGIEYVGYLANPKVTFTQDRGANNWRFSSSLGFTYGSEDYHDYYYEVAPRFVTEDRPLFNAASGYSGTYFKSSVIRRHGSWRYGVSLRYDNISGTDFSKHSPLVETDHYFAVSFLVAKFLWVSSD